MGSLWACVCEAGSAFMPSSAAEGEQLYLQATLDQAPDITERKQLYLQAALDQAPDLTERKQLYLQAAIEQSSDLMEATPCDDSPAPVFWTSNKSSSSPNVSAVASTRRSKRSLTLNIPHRPAPTLPQVQQLRKALSLNFPRVIDVFRKWDLDTSGGLSRKEFCRALQLVIEGTTREAAGALFDTFDVDKSGVVDYSELDRQLRQMNHRGAPQRPASASSKAAGVPRAAWATEGIAGHAAHRELAAAAQRSAVAKAREEAAARARRDVAMHGVSRRVGTSLVLVGTQPSYSALLEQEELRPPTPAEAASRATASRRDAARRVQAWAAIERGMFGDPQQPAPPPPPRGRSSSWSLQERRQRLREAAADPQHAAAAAAAAARIREVRALKRRESEEATSTARSERERLVRSLAEASMCHPALVEARERDRRRARGRTHRGRGDCGSAAERTNHHTIDHPMARGAIATQQAWLFAPRAGPPASKHRPPPQAIALDPFAMLAAGSTGIGSTGIGPTGIGLSDASALAPPAHRPPPSPPAPPRLPAS